MQKENKVSFVVHGRYALFSDPLTRVGGEKSSYQIPTYQALKGILESVYWKPTITWIIDRVRVMKAIRTESKNVKPLKYYENDTKKKYDLSIYTYLRDVAYQVEAHFIWNENRQDLAHDRNENKHYFVAQRMIERGGRRDVFLGTRECQAYVESCVFGEGEGYYDDHDQLSFGLMFHGFDYPSETGNEQLVTRFWTPHMKYGIVDFVTPEACHIRKNVRPMSMEQIQSVNLEDDLSLADLWQEDQL